MSTPLRIPAALAFTVLGVSGAVTGCGDTRPTLDANACVYCVYDTVDTGNCPFPTCATGDNHDLCPEGCIPQPPA